MLGEPIYEFYRCLLRVALSRRIYLFLWLMTEEDESYGQYELLFDLGVAATMVDVAFELLSSPSLFSTYLSCWILTKFYLFADMIDEVIAIY